MKRTVNIRLVVETDRATESAKDPQETLEARVDKILCFGTVAEAIGDSGLDVECIEVVGNEETTAKMVLEKLVDTIEATGGVSQSRDGARPEGDPEWINLGDCYLLACRVLGHEPMIVKADDDDLGDEEE